jgi:hypothetical protein
VAELIEVRGCAYQRNRRSPTLTFRRQADGPTEVTAIPRLNGAIAYTVKMIYQYERGSRPADEF